MIPATAISRMLSSVAAWGILVGALLTPSTPVRAQSTVVLVENGVPTGEAIIQGTWTPGPGEISARGLGAVISGNVGVGAGDFHIEARFTVSDEGCYGVLFERIGYGTIPFSPFHIGEVLPPEPHAQRDRWTVH